jgi:hypothetical protein
VKTYIFRGKPYRAPNKDSVLRRNGVPVSPANLKTVKKIKKQGRITPPTV